MGRKKKENKNVVKSISVPQYMSEFIEQRKGFDFSKFVQMHLREYIELCRQVEE